MSELRSIVIVGAGLAGAKAAETLRAEGFDGEVVLIGAEAESPYERPPLSKGYLRGEVPFDESLVHPHDWYAAHDVELLTGTLATRLDLAAQQVELADGRLVDYDRLLLTTGAQPRELPLTGIDLEGAFVLRDRRDADLLRARLGDGGPLAVVGAGWIGCEVAASARQMGCQVTILEAAATPLEHALGTQLGEHIAALHRDHGTDVRCGVQIERIEGSPDVQAVLLADGTRIEAHTVVVGIGVAPRAELAQQAGLANARGIEVDAFLQTRAPGVFAAGDVAHAEHPRYRCAVRVEHWSNAIDQGAAAARSILGHARPYDEIPYFFSDQYESGLEYIGLHSPADRLVVRNGEGTALTALWTSSAGEVTAGMHIDNWGAADALKALVGARADRSRLHDPEIPLADLAGAAQAPVAT